MEELKTKIEECILELDALIAKCDENRRHIIQRLISNGGRRKGIKEIVSDAYANAYDETVWIQIKKGTSKTYQMKAKEYFTQYMTENQDKDPDWRLCFALNGILKEFHTITKARNAQTIPALTAIYKELGQKASKLIAMLNEVEPYASEGKIKPDAFTIFAIHEIPVLKLLPTQ